MLTPVQFIRTLAGPVWLAVKSTFHFWRSSMADNFFTKLTPYLAGVGASLLSLDENETGPDDVVGSVLLWAADVVSVVEAGGEELPPLPPILADGIGGKINSATRTAIILVSGPLAIAQFQLTASKPRLAKALGYVRQVLQAIAANRQVPQPPAELR